MSLWGVFNDAALAMTAQSTGLTAVSQNVANVNTTAYKGLDVEFKTLMTEIKAPFKFASTQPVIRNMIDRSGTVSATGLDHDLAIGGNGLFIVNTKADGTGETLYSRDGNFGTAAPVPGATQSVLTTTSGHTVMGWKADDRGNFGVGGKPVPILANDVSVVKITGNPTTAVTIIGNVNAAATAPASISVPIKDNTGTEQALTLNWTPPTTPAAPPVPASPWLVDFSVANGKVATPLPTTTNVSFSLSGQLTSPNPTPVTIAWADGTTSTVKVDLGLFTQNAAPTVVSNYTENGRSPAQYNIAGIATKSVKLQANVDASATTRQTLSMPINDTKGTLQSLVMNWEPDKNNTWKLNMQVGNHQGVVAQPGAGNTDIASPGITLTPSSWAEPGKVDFQDSLGNAFTVTLAGGESLATVASLINTAAATALPAPAIISASVPAPGNLNIATTSPTGFTILGATSTNEAVSSLGLPYGNTVTFDSKANLTSSKLLPVNITWADGTKSTISVDISKVTQYSGKTIVDNIAQDGKEPGQFNKSYFDSKGVLYYSYSNGLMKPMYKIPLATFPSVNNLEQRNGTVFAETELSGGPVLGAASTNGTRDFVIGAVERSNVSLEDQFTKMTILQKAYSTNAQVFSTANEMTQTVTALIT
ncbi:MAG: flagellar hook-basal body complex protein [Alphaproteobacteria bacterium]